MPLAMPPVDRAGCCKARDFTLTRLISTEIYLMTRRFAAKPLKVQVRLIRSYNFEAAHQLPHVPSGHKCARVHGHSFGVEVVVQGTVDQTLGWCIDYGDIDAIWQPLYQAFDHHFLNEIPGLENPTSENLARFIWDYFKERLPSLVRVIVTETPDARCEYEGN